MVLISAQGKNIILGREGDNIPEFQQPTMTVSFSYDYSLSAKEISAGLFGKVMGDSYFEFQGELPAVNVSWNEAVLFCNNLSIAQGLDTAYTFSQANYDQTGKLINLQNVYGVPGSNGFRLPTEAEWFFAATGGTGNLNQNEPYRTDRNQYEWNAMNSNGTLHVPGSKKPLYELYDMIGNALEWTNDIMEKYPGGSFTNFIHTTSKNNDQRVVKGGAYVYDPSYINPYRRLDVYDITSSSRLPYLGFRIAQGSFPDTSFSDTFWLNQESPQVFQTIASSQQLQNFSGSTGKLVFVGEKDKKIHYKDYSDPSGSIHTLSDTVNPYHPMISPDGKWVAYCTAMEGQSKPSQIYVRELKENSQILLLGAGAIPRWWVNPTEADTFLVYASSAAGNQDSLAWLQSQTNIISFHNGAFGETNQLSQGNFHGGLSREGNILATAFPNMRIKYLTEQKTVMRFVSGLNISSGGNGKPVEGSSQVCNLSMSTSNESRIAFLDFGYTQGNSSFTGDAYNVHYYLFLADSDGILQSKHAPPLAFDEWTEPEWTQGADYIVSTVSQQDDQANDIYLFSPQNQQFLHLLHGNGVMHPHFWFPKNPLPWAMDSLGWYAYPEKGDRRKMFAFKIPEFWKKHNQVEVMILGTSRMNSFRVSAFSDYEAVNMAFNGATFTDMNNFSSRYVLPHCPNLKAVILPIDPDFMVWPDSESWNDISGTYGYLYDSAHSFWQDNLPEDVEEILISHERPNMPNFTTEGTALASNASWGDPVFWRKDEWDLSNPLAQKNLSILEETIKAYSTKGIHTVGIIMPVNPAYSKMGYYSKYGTPNATVKKLTDFYDSIATANPYFHLMDEHRMGNHDYTDVDADNLDHLNNVGCDKLSTRILDSLKIFLKEP